MNVKDGATPAGAASATTSGARSGVPSDTGQISHSGTSPARHAWVGLGANLGDAAATLRNALAQLTASVGITDVVASPFYRSAPVDAQGPVFVNAVARLRSTLAPIALLDLLQDIEQRHGRERPYRNAPRTLDMDLLLVEGVTMDSPRLTLPHPRLHQRAFVLQPLRDLNPDLLLDQGAFDTLLAACADQAIERM